MSMEITFITDYVCPYCIVAKEQLKAALQKLNIEADITYLPYELTPEPEQRVDTYHDEKRKERYHILKNGIAELNLDIKLPPSVIPRPYSRLAFEGMFFARDHGLEEKYSDLIYKKYFIEEQDIGDIEVLTSVAKTIGLNEEEFKAALETRQYTNCEKQAVEKTIAEYHPKTVPVLYINGIHKNLSTYVRSEFIEILQGFHSVSHSDQADIAEVKENDSEAEGTSGCDADGCH